MLTHFNRFMYKHRLPLIPDTPAVSNDDPEFLLERLEASMGVSRKLLESNQHEQEAEPSLYEGKDGEQEATE